MDISIIVTGHGEFAEAFQSALNLLIGETPNTYFINFNEEFEAFQLKLSNLISNLSTTSKEVIIFTDLAGGSPFNVSCLSAKNYSNITIIGGSNLPMVIDVLTNIMYDLGDITTESILNAGHESLVCFSKNSHHKNSIEEDGI